MLYIMFRFVSLGPRLSSFVIDTENNVLDVTDAVKLLPLRHNQILNICGYPLHGMDSELLIHLPPDVVISEYGIQVWQIVIYDVELTFILE